MPRVYISHSPQDREFVEREIVALLRSHGIEAWYSRDDSASKAAWNKMITEGLPSCDWFLVVLSPRSAESEWVEFEVTWALEKCPDRLVTVLAESCTVEKLSRRLACKQHFNFAADKDAARTQLLAVWKPKPVSLIGKVLHKYRIIEKLGSGGMADVYKGIQIGLDREVAIKVLPPAFAVDREMVKRFRRLCAPDRASKGRVRSPRRRGIRAPLPVHRQRPRGREEGLNDLMALTLLGIGAIESSGRITTHATPTANRRRSKRAPPGRMEEPKHAFRHAAPGSRGDGTP